MKFKDLKEGNVFRTFCDTTYFRYVDKDTLYVEQSPEFPENVGLEAGFTFHPDDNVILAKVTKSFEDERQTFDNLVPGATFNFDRNDYMFVSLSYSHYYVAKLNFRGESTMSVLPIADYKNKEVKVLVSNV